MKKMEVKKIIYLAGSLFILILVLCFVYSQSKKQSNLSFPASNEVAPSNTKASGSTIKKPSGTAAPLSATKAYLDALKIYKTTGYYFQFVNCHGSPGSFTLKAGKKFMLDNRDGVAHKIKVQGGQSFNISAYGFAIATAPSTVGDHYIDCDGGGAAKIVVQK